MGSCTCLFPCQNPGTICEKEFKKVFETHIPRNSHSSWTGPPPSWTEVSCNRGNARLIAVHTAHRSYIYSDLHCFDVSLRVFPWNGGVIGSSTCFFSCQNPGTVCEK